jgi:hypothetical protein
LIEYYGYEIFSPKPSNIAVYGAIIDPIFRRATHYNIALAKTVRGHQIFWQLRQPSNNVEK